MDKRRGGKKKRGGEKGREKEKKKEGGKEEEEKNKRGGEKGEEKKEKESGKRKKCRQGANSTFYHLSLTGEAVLPNFFKMTPTPPEKPLHQRSQSRSHFWRSRSPTKQARKWLRLIS
jgi:hypothetical protein